MSTAPLYRTRAGTCSAMITDQPRCPNLPPYKFTGASVRGIAGKLMCSLLADVGPDIGLGATAVMAESYSVD